jgi:hypothetical protein
MLNLIRVLTALSLILSSFTAVSGIMTVNSGSKATLQHYSVAYNGNYVFDGIDFGESISHPTETVTTLNNTFQLSFNDLTPQNYKFYFFGGCGDNTVCSAMNWQYSDVQWSNLTTSSANLLCDYAGLSAAQCPQVSPEKNTALTMGHSNGYEINVYDNSTEPFSETSAGSSNYSKSIRLIDELANEMTIIRMNQYFGLYSELASTWGNQFKTPTAPELWDWFGHSGNKLAYNHSLEIEHFSCDSVVTINNCRTSSYDSFHMYWRDGVTTQLSSVPSPSTTVCIVLGLVGIAWRRRRNSL